MKVCSECGRQFTFSEKYCYKCGKELVKAPRCECGELLQSPFEYCPNCGKKVEK